MKSQLRFLRYAILLSLLAWSLGCAEQGVAPVYTKEGKEYGKTKGAFRHRWWNYYERGVSYGEGEFYSEAAADFKTAIEQRYDDQRMARTYGMHFIDYFPHRELGITQYRMGNLNAAGEELELSIRQFPTAKARFYLDRVRKALIEEEGKKTTPPGLVLDPEKEEVWTREDPVIVKGVAEDEQYVAGISIRGRPVFMEGAEKRVLFREALHLPQGDHEVSVEARNLVGGMTVRKVLIHVDREGPVITLEKVETGPSGNLLTGSAYDRAGVAEVKIDGVGVVRLRDQEVLFEHVLPVGRKEAVLVAKDELGNETAVTFPVLPPTKAGFLIRLASADPSLVLAGILGSKDSRPPDIRLKGWTESQTVMLEKAYIEGQVMDEGTVAGLSINGVPVLRREGQYVFFNYLAELQKGQNRIVIEARDQAGNQITKAISVTREIPKALQLQERLSTTVLPFEQSGAASETSFSFQDRLTDTLVDLNRFRVVERNKLDLVLQEQKLSRTELIDKSTALRTGKLVAAQSIVTGTIVETRTGIEIVARMIDTETSEILAIQDVYDEAKDLAALRVLAEGLALKIHRDFPLVGGFILQRKGDAVFTDLGEDKIKLQRRLILYREEPLKHPATGKMLGVDNVIIGHARVTQVMPEMSKAEVVSGNAESVTPQDKVITE